MACSPVCLPLSPRPAAGSISARHVVLPPCTAGTVALQRCDDDFQALQLELCDLQRSTFATGKTAPDVAAHDRTIAALRADVLQARREADAFGAALEAPVACPDRWRVLPGELCVLGMGGSEAE